MLKRNEYLDIYRSTFNDFDADFMNPSYAESIAFDRGSGFFSLKSLILSMEGLIKFIRNGGNIRLICNPELSNDDIDLIAHGVLIDEKRATNDLLNSYSMEEISNDDEIKMDIISNLIENGRLKIKVAFMNDGIYHEKIGIFTDENNETILLYMEPHNAHCSDINEELINLYNVVKTDPEGLITELRPYVNMNNSENYLTIRGLDRIPVLFNTFTPVQKAARFMYLNHTCFNGIWRVNRKGQNNVPFGRYVSPKILAEEEIREASRLFNENNISFEVNDYRVVANRAQAGDVVYFDPPYDVEEGQNGFVGYTAGGFNRDNQRELKELCDELIQRGVTVGISNSNTTFIRELYSDDPYQHVYKLLHHY